MYIMIYNIHLTQLTLVSERNSVVVCSNPTQDQLSIATSKNSSVVNTIWMCSFPLNSCDCLCLNITFLTSGRLSGRNDVTSEKVNFRPDIRQIFLKKNEDIKTLCSF